MKKISHLLKLINIKYSIFFRASKYTANLFCTLLFLKQPNKWLFRIYDVLEDAKYKIIRGNVSFDIKAYSEVPLQQARLFNIKEPETLKWLESMTSDDILYDVGANLGLFTIYGSHFCKEVYAFEPQSRNYHLLNQNIILSKKQDSIKAYALAISDRVEINSFNLINNRIGTSHHIFKRRIDLFNNPLKIFFSQGALGVSLDFIVFDLNLPPPTYLKIDIDGNQDLVIEGAKRLLKLPSLKTVLVEINKSLNKDSKLVSTIIESGYKITNEGEDIVANDMIIGNVIFHRKEV